MKTILLAEDHDTLRKAFVRALETLDDVEIMDTPSAADARDMIDATPPDLLVSDLDLIDGSGLDILSYMHECGLRVPVIFITAYLGTFRDRIPSGKEIEIHEKPIAISQLRELVEKHLSPSAGEYEGVPFAPFEYVQLACLGRHSLVVDVADSDGGPAGRILVVEGELWAARCGEKRGIAALAALATLQGARATCETARPPFGEREIADRWESAMLEATRQADEFEAGFDDLHTSPPGSPTARAAQTAATGWGAFDSEPDDDEWLESEWAVNGSKMEADEPRPPAQLSMHTDRGVRVLVEELIDEATEAMLGKDYETAQRALRDALELDPDHRTVRANLERIEQLQETS